MTGRVRKPMHDDPTRAVQRMTLGLVRNVDARNSRRNENRVRETHLQFQLPITGDAVNIPAWSDFPVAFDHHFYYSPGTQDNDLDAPNFTWGAELPGDPVVISAHVVDWTRDADNEAVVGAIVRVGASLPGATDPVSFSGTLHLTFTGFASLFEDETDETE